MAGHTDWVAAPDYHQADHTSVPVVVVGQIPIVGLVVEDKIPVDLVDHYQHHRDADRAVRHSQTWVAYQRDSDNWVVHLAEVDHNHVLADHKGNRLVVDTVVAVVVDIQDSAHAVVVADRLLCIGPVEVEDLVVEAVEVPVD